MSESSQVTVPWFGKSNVRNRVTSTLVTTEYKFTAQNTGEHVNKYYCKYTTFAPLPEKVQALTGTKPSAPRPKKLIHAPATLVPRRHAADRSPINVRWQPQGGRG